MSIRECYNKIVSIMPDFSKCDFSKALIYKLICKDPEIKEVYVGSTCDLEMRMSKHKSDCKRLHVKVYKFISENGGWDNWTVEIIQDYPCSGVEELKILEQHYIKEMGTLNSKSADTGCDKKEYDRLRYEENKDKRNKDSREYNKKKREKIKEKNKEWRDKNKKEYDRLRYEENKDKRNKESREYNKKNREKIKEKNKEWRDKNKQKVGEDYKKWYEENKEKKKEYERLRRLKKKAQKESSSTEMTSQSPSCSVKNGKIQYSMTEMLSYRPNL